MGHRHVAAAAAESNRCYV